MHYWQKQRPDPEVSVFEMQTQKAVASPKKKFKFSWKITEYFKKLFEILNIRRDWFWRTSTFADLLR